MGESIGENTVAIPNSQSPNAHTQHSGHYPPHSQSPLPLVVVGHSLATVKL